MEVTDYRYFDTNEIKLHAKREALDLYHCKVYISKYVYKYVQIRSGLILSSITLKGHHFHEWDITLTIHR